MGRAAGNAFHGHVDHHDGGRRPMGPLARGQLLDPFLVQESLLDGDPEQGTGIGLLGGRLPILAIPEAFLDLGLADDAFLYGQQD
jgi:hypothetical protein